MHHFFLRLSFLFISLISFPLFSETKGTAQYKLYFSPDDQVIDKLITLINNEPKSIKMAVYAFTHREVVNALIRAKKKGTMVEVIVDPFSIKAKSPLKRLVTAQIPLYVWDPIKEERYQNKQVSTKQPRRALMHDKFCVFGDHTVWTGSFNFTYDANNSHQENALVLQGSEIAKRYDEEFQIIKNRGCKTYRDFVSQIRGKKSTSNKKLQKLPVEKESA